MIITSSVQRTAYREAAKISVDILRQLWDKTAIGVYPIEVEELCQKLLKEHQVTSSFAPVRNHQGPYGHSMCVCVNDVTLHGLPTTNRPFAENDVIKLDFGLVYQGLNTDFCVTVGLQELSKKNRHLITTTKEAVLLGVDEAVAGNTTGHIGSAISQRAKKAGFDVVKEYIGHGIGTRLHDAPSIPAYGYPGHGDVLVENQVICVEAQVVAGSDEVKTLPDGWTVVTEDGKNSAMFEYLVIVGRTQPEILTDTLSWGLWK